MSKTNTLTWMQITDATQKAGRRRGTWGRFWFFVRRNLPWFMTDY